MPSTRDFGRLAVLGAGVLVVVVLAVLLLGVGRSDYRVHAIFENASQLVKGNLVQVAGAPVGKVTDLALTPDGRADVTLEIGDGAYRPLREGTIATVRQASLSGIANRYVDLRLPPAGTPNIADGGRITEAQTNSAVDLDQLFDTFDPTTRRDLSGVIRGLATIYGGQSAALSRGYLYLSPALAASSDLFAELDRDTPLLTRFVAASSKLVTDLAAERQHLSGAVDHLARATTAIGSQRAALADGIHQLPAFLRRADTTFVNLRATLDDLRPLVEDAKPVARKLRPFLHVLRPLARDARPTLRILQQLIENPKAPNSGLLALVRTTVPVRAVAVGPTQVNGASRPGALPATTDALATATPELGFARPYAPELTSWFNSFGHSGVYDALGGASRVAIFANPFALIDGLLTPIPPALRQAALAGTLTTGQRDRCPGSAEHPSADGSNPYHPPGFPCDPTQIPPGQ
ncbi:MAG: phospholipid/cholesterol/gamma-HCH transport system substrate-binding protein [Solirubrobacteraceae bacterium]|nr:phospholipid/cholesterol/gamma-HCH transport system substrate-binding protein [Solirubrobacteraceae bacterium]MEA2356407.1 phospholipid/cholesterol/gamma-HCH transport system substrate-binding protein [Solirubrobacteraceae bacterium]